MATAEKPKQKKNKKPVPLKSVEKQASAIAELEQEQVEKQPVEEQASSCADEVVKDNETSIEKSENSREKQFHVIQSSTEHEPRKEEKKETKITSDNEFEKLQDIKPSISAASKQIKDKELIKSSKDSIAIDKKAHEMFAASKIKPSAPELEEPVRPVSYPLLPKQETSQPMRQVVKSEVMKPFTRAQLDALYTNPELVASREFETCFVESELRQAAFLRHPLHEMLCEYARVRERLRESRAELEKCRAEIGKCEERVWVLEKTSISGSKQCADGQVVRASHKYQTARMQRPALDEISRLQQQIRLLANDTHTLCSYMTVTLNLKIEHYLQSVISTALSSGVHALPVVLSPAPQLQLRDLRLCISILFWFQRRPCRDRALAVETRAWLSGCVAALLRLADWQDHAYLLCHVLRSPAGCGQWAARFVQVPSSGASDGGEVFADRYLNHALAVVGLILRGVTRRGEFLEQIVTQGQDPVAENLWVLVDSDGEEDENGPIALKENDLVAILNQVPLADLFQYVLQIKSNSIIDVKAITEHHMLRLFAFCTVLVDLFNQGLTTYGTQRYNQFVKRLCRLIRHTLQYASDIWEVFRSRNKLVDDSLVLERLQIEYDMLFLCCGKYLYHAQGLGAWQFLAVLPFHTVTIQRLWQFFYMLHEKCEPVVNEDADYREKLSDVNIQQQFEERLCVMGVEESYYLLNTFGNMIMSRNEEDCDFIQFATVNLLQIGFVGQATQETCSKSAAILLSNITMRYPNLISDLLYAVSQTITQIGKLCLYLFRELPLYLWKPTDKDIGVLNMWLTQNPLNSIESHLGRLILSEMNWDVDKNTGASCLPLQLHFSAALLAAELVERYCSEGVVSVTKTPESSALRWAWQLVYRLRLHATDRGLTDFSRVPDLVTFDLLQKGVRQQQPLCSFLSLMLTTTGHLVPMVCSHGFTQLQVMMTTYCYEAVLVALHHILPLFLDCSESLVVSVSFQNILSTLLSADRTYVKMAKSLICNEFPGKVLRQMEQMLEHQWAAQSRTGRGPLLQLWAQALVAPAQWNKDPAALYLLNLIVKLAFFERDMFEAVAHVFKKLLEKCLERAGSGSSLLSWMSGSASPPTLLGTPSSQSQFPWLAYLCLDVEHELLEQRTKLWDELLKQLSQATGKTNVDNCLKKACGVVKVPAFTSGGLCVYRWAGQAADTPLDHPLLPLIWQRFFHLYLGRVPAYNDTPAACVGHKFFDGVVNTTFCKKLKRRLQECIASYENTEDVSGETSQRCHALYRAYLLWLEEPLLQESSLYLPSLPAQYEPRYLAHILQGSRAPWVELIDLKELRLEHERSLAEWEVFLGRDKTAAKRTAPITPGLDSKDPEKRISRRLMSYDRPQPPPELPKDKCSQIPRIPVEDKDLLTKTMQLHLRKLEQLAELYSLQCAEFLALDGQFKELLPHLYKTVHTGVQLKRTCGATCSGHALIMLDFGEARLNEAVRQQLGTNRSNIEALLSRTLQPLEQTTTATCAAIERSADELCSRVVKASPEAELRSVGAELFHLLVDTYRDDIGKYPPTQQLFTTCIDKLGGAFMTGAEREYARLCRSILKQPHKSHLMIKHFNPVNIGTANFLQIYCDIVDKIGEIPIIVNALLDNVDVGSWLTNKHPRLADRSQFINLVFAMLGRLSNAQEAQLKPLHELARKHLLLVFKHEFPEHYGEVLRHALNNSGSGQLSSVVWRDLIEVLMRPGELRDLEAQGAELRQLAANQRMLRQEMLVESIAMLGRYFSQERVRYGAVYGVYPRYHNYVQHLSLLFSFVSHSLISTVVSNTGALADRLVEVTFPHLVELYGPWALPNWPSPALSAVQQRQPGDNRALTLPWLQADAELAKKIFSGFVECIGFMMDTLPANTSVLCHVWQFYAHGYAHPAVKAHVLTVVHSCLLALSWKRFWPSVQDLETMLKVADQYLPECHTFLSHVFLEVEWTQWLYKLNSAPCDIAVMCRVHLCLLHLLVKLAGEGVVGDKACRLMDSARMWAWQLLRPPEISQVLDWYVMSADPRIVILDEVDVKKTDHAVIKLLSLVSCYENPAGNPLANTGSMGVMKRQCFLRASMKLLVNCSSRHKALVISQPQLVQRSITRHLDHIEHIVTTASHNPKEESDLLLTEVLSLINNATLCTVAVETIEAWLLTRSSSSPALLALMRVAGVGVAVAEPAGRLLEAAFVAYFGQGIDRAEQSDRKMSAWSGAVVELKTGPPRQPPIEQSLVTHGRLLALHAIVLKRTQNCDDWQLMMDSVINWLGDVKITEGVECKLPLVWGDVLALASKQCALLEFGDQSCQVATLRRWSQQLLGLAENSKGAGWGRAVLGALTGNRHSCQLSQRGRLLARALAGYVLAQLPSAGGTVRCAAGAVAPVGQPGGNVDCAKILLKLDPGLPELKPVVEFALKQIQDPQNAMHNAVDFLYSVTAMLYSKPYLAKN